MAGNICDKCGCAWAYHGSFCPRVGRGEWIRARARASSRANAESNKPVNQLAAMTKDALDEADALGRLAGARVGPPNTKSASVEDEQRRAAAINDTVANPYAPFLPSAQQRWFMKGRTAPVPAGPAVEILTNPPRRYALDDE